MGEGFRAWLLANVIVNLMILVTLWWIVGHLSTLVTRLTGLMLAVQELCDRIWDLRGE